MAEKVKVKPKSTLPKKTELPGFIKQRAKGKFIE
jgi:hypothetical protein